MKSPDSDGHITRSTRALWPRQERGWLEVETAFKQGHLVVPAGLIALGTWEPGHYHRRLSFCLRSVTEIGRGRPEGAEMI